MTSQVNNLNPILLKNQKNLYHSNIFKARLSKIASIINLLCIFIFCIYIISFIGVSTITIPIYNLGIGISLPILSMGAKIFNDMSKRCYKTAKFYKKIFLELKTLKSQNIYEIKKYLNEINCFNVKNINEILPALAEYKVWVKTQKYFLNEIKKIKKINSIDLNFNYKMQKLIHEIHEKEVLNSKLNLAQLYHIINNPTDKRMLSNFGKIFTMSFSKRMDSFSKKDDFYFVFYDDIQKEKKRKSISFTEVEEMQICNISKLIFAN